MEPGYWPKGTAAPPVSPASWFGRFAYSGLQRKSANENQTATCNLFLPPYWAVCRKTLQVGKARFTPPGDREPQGSANLVTLSVEFHHRMNLPCGVAFEVGSPV